MEAQIGFALFVRATTRLFTPTEALALHKEAESIFALHANLENRVRDLRDSRSGHLRIVATPPLAYSVIPPALNRFLIARPKLRVYFDVRRYEGIIESIANRVTELGFALGLSSHPGIAPQTVRRGEMVCVMPKGHELSSRPVVSPRDLAPFPFIALERERRLAGAVPRGFKSAATPS